MTISVEALFVAETKEKILKVGLALAKILGLKTSSWREGDPTLTTFEFEAEVLSTQQEAEASFAKSAFLSTAEDDWKTVVASEVYGVERDEATYATPTVTLTNGAGGYYDPGVGDITVKASATGKTFHNTDTSDGPLSPGATRTYQLVADEAGSDSSVAVDEIDTLVTSMLGVTIDSSTAADGADQQSDDSLEEECNGTLGALSPNGPPDAYEYVALKSELTGVTDVTRARTVDADTDDGKSITYIAGSSGPVAGASVTAVQDAIEQWATPIGFRSTATNATAQTINLTVQVSGDAVPADAEALASAAIGSAFQTWPISDGTGVVSDSFLRAKVHVALGLAPNDEVTLVGFSNVTLAAGKVPVIGAFSLTEV